MRIPLKSNDVKLPVHTIPLGIVFKGEVCVTLSFHKTEMLGFIANREMFFFLHDFFERE